MLFFKRKKQSQDLDVDAPAFGLPAQPSPTGSILGGQDIGSPIGQSSSGPLSMAAQVASGATKPIDIMRDPGLAAQAPLSPVAAAPPPVLESNSGPAGDLGAGTLTSYANQYDAGGTMATPPALEDTPPKTDAAVAMPLAPAISGVADQYDTGGTMATPPAGPTLPNKPQPDLDPTTDYLAAHHPDHAQID